MEGLGLSAGAAELAGGGTVCMCFKKMGYVAAH